MENYRNYGIDLTIDDVTSKNLYELVLMFKDNDQTINSLCIFLIYLNRNRFIDYETEESTIVKYINFIIRLISRDIIDYDELLILTKDLIDSKDDTLYLSLFYKLKFICDNDIDDENRDEFLDYIDDLTEINDFTAKFKKAFYLYEHVEADEYEPYYEDKVTGINMLIELYDDSRCPNNYKVDIAYYLGYEYLNGYVIDVDLNKAYYYLNVSKELGSQKAALLLVDMYINGKCKFKDEKLAYKLLLDLYIESKEKFLSGYEPDNYFREISYKLGSLNEEGIGTDKDLYLAYSYYLESYAAYNNEMEDFSYIDDDDEIDYEEYGDLVEKIDVISEGLDLEEETPNEHIVSVVNDAVRDCEIMSLQIKDLKKSYKFIFEPMNDLYERFFVKQPEKTEAFLASTMILTVNKDNVDNIWFRNPGFYGVVYAAYNENGLCFYDENESVVLKLDTNKIKIKYE